MDCDIGHTHLWRLMWGWRLLLQVALKCLSWFRGNLSPASCWIVGGHKWWSPEGCKCGGFPWCCKHMVWQEVLYFLHHARTGGYFTGTLCNRVQGRDWHHMTIEEQLSENHPEWFWEELSAIEWPHQWILPPKLVVQENNPYQFQTSI